MCWGCCDSAARATKSSAGLFVCLSVPYLQSILALASRAIGIDGVLHRSIETCNTAHEIEHVACTMPLHR